MNRTFRIVFIFLASLCLHFLEAQVRFPLDEAKGATGALVMPGAVGNAVRFNGYSSYLKKTYNATSLSTSKQTISLWCAAETYPMMNAAEAENAYTSIIETIDDNAHTGFALRLSSQGNLRFECYSDDWKVTVDADELLPKYQWNHVVITLDTEQRQIVMYNNGQVIGQGRTMGSLSVGTGNLYIGKDNKSLFYQSYMLNTFNGLIDDVRIDNHIWTDDEIANVEPQNEADLIYPQDAFYHNPLRPHFHGMPMMGWTNETHGMAVSEDDGQKTYHLFFQKNPNGPYMARLHWGHLTSTDLCGWTEQPIAIAPAEDYDIKGCWSGCVLKDEQITGGQTWIAYTGVDNAKATINFAMPNNTDLLSWQKAENNPCINGRPSGLTDDFRDPYFFRNGDKAYMVVGSSKNGVGVTTLHEFREDGSLTNDGRLFFAGTNVQTCGTFFEMPNITKIGNKWLFTATPLGSSVGVRTVYWVGDINADGQFVPDNDSPKTVELTGFARDGYGLLSPTICQTDGKTIVLGIVPDKLSSAVNYDMGWAHSYSLPREWTLTEDGTLLQKPYSGLTALRTNTAFENSSLTLNGTQDITVANGMQVEAQADFIIGQADCGFSFFGDKMKVYYKPSTKQIIADFSALSRKQNDQNIFSGVYSSSLPESVAAGDNLNLHVYFDHSVLDIFINDKWASSVRVFPSEQAENTVRLFANTATTVNNVAVYDLETTVTTKNYPLVEPETDQIGGNFNDLENIFISEDGTYRVVGNYEVYNIVGQRVCSSNLQPNTIYIVNGQKIILCK